MKRKTINLMFKLSVLLLFFPVSLVSAAQFEVLRPGKINIPRNIKKVFIDPDLINSDNDKLELKNDVVVTLKRRLNDLGRFQTFVGPPRGFDPNRETVAIIQGDIISGGEIDQGQLTEKAICRGGLSGAIGALSARESTQQGLTLSRRRMLCKLPNLTSQLVESGLTAGLSALGVKEYPRLDEVIRVYKYKNFSIFAQINLSFTQIGSQRETLAIRADAASFSRHVIDPDTYQNVRESGDNASLIWLWFRVTPVAPVVIKKIGIIQGSNPGSHLGKWYNRKVPNVSDIPKKERQKITMQLVNKTLTQFIQTISPYKSIIETEIASGGDSKAREKLEEGRYQEVKKILHNPNDPEDLYNLGLAYEAGALTIEDYEDAMYYYSQALDKDPNKKLYAQGIGRMEFQLRIAKKLKKQTGK